MKISKWDTWQTYRSDRSTPPWIKVYRNLLSNPEWVSLSDSEKGQLVSMWILGADKSGTIPDDPRLIQKMCMLDDAPDIAKFADLGFLEPQECHGDNQVVTKTPHSDAADKTRLDKTRLDKKDHSVISVPAGKEKYSIEFGLFWDTYPSHRRGNKKKAFEHWKKIPDDLYDEITNHVAARKSQDAKWIESNGKYIPHAERFLSGERWEEGWIQESKFSDVTQKNLSNWANIGDLND
jgi:hypothetical protein